MAALMTHYDVLHVDDDPAMGEIVATYLEREQSGLNCTVDVETDPEVALEELRDGPTEYDCVVSDYDMPEMNGIDFLEAVRESHPELPLLLFSSAETSDVAAEVVHAGLTDYLKKGFGGEPYTMLVRRVEHAMAGGGAFDPESEIELDGVGVVGVDESFDEVDDTYASLYDYESEEVTGKHWTELHPDEEVEHIKTHVLPVVQGGGEWTGRSKGLRADGSTFTESKMVTALDDGRMLIAVSELDA